MTIDGGAVTAPELGFEPAARPDEFMTVVHAVPAAVPATRKLIRQWLETLAWPTEDAEDIELATNEAVSNVVDHAYPPDAPGTATLHAWTSTDPDTHERRVVVTITDRGRWGAHHPAGPAPAARGHGLVVMTGCTAELHIQRSPAGTTVIMVSPEVAPAGSPAAG